MEYQKLRGKMTNQRILITEVWYVRAHGGRRMHYAQQGTTFEELRGAFCGLKPKRGWAYQSNIALRAPYCMKCKRVYRRVVANVY